MDQISHISDYDEQRTPLEDAFHALGFVFDSDAAEAFQELVTHWQPVDRATTAIRTHAEYFLNAFGDVLWPLESAKRQHLELEDPDEGLTYQENGDLLFNKMVHYCNILAPLLTRNPPGKVNIDEEELIERIVQRGRSPNPDRQRAEMDARGSFEEE
ncbi:hypothetical protein KC332_g10451 [Hortaea werneckii]|nr:hypothetical protein KC358_g13229 [Hortaea werneckii]KAI6851421.1 hypothetical protein KC350_g1651 [Hortaea werneckii]KAI6941267.1 hypothetical protein KC341_g2984 [Hortaea werneckii]KAI6948850.1 hypothetical protein KC348_g1705 [Hortaea werneckii]KAI6966996.1 hypothetical protein KC321_g9261 [Hortaea werneckii]